MSVAVNKDGCNNNMPAGPPSQVVRLDAVLPILVEGGVGSVEASTSSFGSNAWAVEKDALEDTIRQLRDAKTQLLDTTNSSQATTSSLGSTPAASRQLSKQEKEEQLPDSTATCTRVA